MTTAKLNQLINRLASITLLEVMVAVRLCWGRLVPRSFQGETYVKQPF
jgi:hypothetical protein